MKSITNIINQLLLLIIVSSFLAGCAGKHDLPNVERLSKDLFYSIQKTKVNYGADYKKLSDIYKLLKCEEILTVEIHKDSYQIQFKGEIELLNTIYNYGNYGYRTKHQPGKMGFIAYKGKVVKGTVFPFTGKAEYALTKTGWKYIQHSVKLANTIVPSF